MGDGLAESAESNQMKKGRKEHEESKRETIQQNISAGGFSFLQFMISFFTDGSRI